MSFAYHLAGNAFILIIIYLLVHHFIPSHVKLDIDEIEDDAIVSDYKLILSTNDEDNTV
jgi:hypothetical protein